MKAPPKLLIGSSPGRGEKLPAPPFSRLLKGKGGSRSRGRRPLSSPALSMSRRSADLLEGKDPVSPKVTCMGQVRIHRKKKKTTTNNKHDKCPWSSLFCKLFSATRWRAWLAGKERRHLLEEEEEEKEPKKNKQQQQQEPFLEEEAAPVSPAAPPKNALLLMRCRSAPSRGSFLGSRLWEPEEEVQEEDEGDPPEESSRGAEGEGGAGVPPPSSPRARALTLLTRCSSEPARRGERRNKLLAMADEAFPRPPEISSHLHAPIDSNGHL